MPCQNREVYFLIPLLLINQRKHSHLFYFKDRTGNKRLALQYLFFCIQTINWCAQSCHCYLALTKSVLLMTSSGSTSTERFAGGSPSFAISAAAEIHRHRRISSWTRAACDTQQGQPSPRAGAAAASWKHLHSSIFTTDRFNLLVAVSFTHPEIYFIVFIFYS